MKKTMKKDGKFRKSTLSPVSDVCVEVGRDEDSIMVRDTKDKTHTTLSFSDEEWKAFVGGVKKGEFDI